VLTTTNKAHSVNSQTVETQQNVRTAIDLLSRDIKQAGFGMVGSVGNCTSAIVPNDNSVSGPDTGPDRISLVVPVGNPVGAAAAPAWMLQNAIGPGFNSLNLSTSQAVSDMAVQAGGTLSNSTLTILGVATAIVTGTSGNSINLASVAAPAAFAANTPIYLLQCITYQVIPPPDTNGLCNGRTPCLVRGVAPGGLNCNVAGSTCVSIADEIEDLQFAYACDGCSLGINGGIPNQIIDDIGTGPVGFDDTDFVSNSTWAGGIMTPDKIRLVRVWVVGRQRMADQGFGESNGQTIQGQVLQVSDHNHANGLYVAGDLGTLNPPYTSTRRRILTQTVEVRNSGK
jgi:type IV pilus assembly protein PilW